MREEDISEQLGKLAFRFFYKYSRFEFALKENGYLRNPNPGSRAAPDWKKFSCRQAEEYSLSDKAAKLIDARPKRQVVASGGRLNWEDVDLPKDLRDLEKVVCLVRVVRNNLFHGGKHGADGWDDPERTKCLLNAGGFRAGSDGRTDWTRRGLFRVLLTHRVGSFSPGG